MPGRRSAQPARKSRDPRDPAPTPARKRRPWRVLTPDELRRPGAVLLGLLIEAANNQGYGTSELAEELGVTYAYLAALRNGKNPIPKIGDELVDRIAAFLQLPKVAVMLAAGQLHPQDFYQQPDIVRHHLMPALKFIQSDSQFGRLLPPSVFNAEPALQHLIITLYEQATGRTLIPTRINPEEIAQRFKDLVRGDIQPAMRPSTKRRG